MKYINPKIKKVLINEKGFGFIAIENISKNTILIKEKPSFKIKEKEIFCDMFQLLYEIFTSNDSKKKKKFVSYRPVNLSDMFFDKKLIEIQFGKLKNNNKGIKIYNFFKQNYSLDEIILFCGKYIQNAFSIKKWGPIILLNASYFNHSCLPNVIFGRIDDYVEFITVKDIKKGEEICNNYIDILIEDSKRNQNLFNQYGFKCNCCRCIATNIKTKKILVDEVKNIVNQRIKRYR